MIYNYFSHKECKQLKFVLNHLINYLTTKPYLSSPNLIFVKLNANIKKSSNNNNDNKNKEITEFNEEDNIKEIKKKLDNDIKKEKGIK